MAYLCAHGTGYSFLDESKTAANGPTNVHGAATCFSTDNFHLIVVPQLSENGRSGCQLPQLSETTIK